MVVFGIPVRQPKAGARSPHQMVGNEDGADDFFDIPHHATALAEFLAVCARSLNADPSSPREQFTDELYWARDIFVRAGLEALAARPWNPGAEWIQFSIHPVGRRDAYGELCGQVAGFARRLLDDSAVDNFFFMNKPPGMRIRFQTAESGSSAEIAAVLQNEAARWREAGLIDFVERSVYEPESQLFGGPRSMDFVHALFTLDSLIWLDYHGYCAGGADDGSPAWLVSLAVLRTVFAGLDITGWEDIGVWDRIRDFAGRRISGDKSALTAYMEVAGDIREIWSRRGQIVDMLAPRVRTVVRRSEQAIFTGAAQWRSEYFCQPGASIGPRAAAAFYVLFHWNRGALPLVEQALLAESLGQRIGEDGHR